MNNINIDDSILPNQDFMHGHWTQELFQSCCKFSEFCCLAWVFPCSITSQVVARVSNTARTLEAAASRKTKYTIIFSLMILGWFLEASSRVIEERETSKTKPVRRFLMFLGLCVTIYVFFEICTARKNVRKIISMTPTM